MVLFYNKYALIIRDAQFNAEAMKAAFSFQHRTQASAHAFIDENAQHISE